MSLHACASDNVTSFVFAEWDGPFLLPSEYCLQLDMGIVLSNELAH